MDPQSLMSVYNGWDGYQRALVQCIAPRHISAGSARRGGVGGGLR